MQSGFDRRWLLLGLVLAGPLWAQSSAPPMNGDKKAGKAPVAAEDEFPLPKDEPAVLKKFPAAVVQKLCQRYNGQLIAYYGEIYKVEHCHRRQLLDNKTVYAMQREGHMVQDVDSDTVAAIPEGEPLDEAMTVSNARGCKQLEGRYVTFSNTDVYFVEGCKRRIFPDWTTYIKHREPRDDKKGEILSLSWLEFTSLPSGKPIPSIVDDLFAKMLRGDAGVEVIPINEACHGVEGRLVTYYSRAYRIEHCRKRELAEADLYLKGLGFDKVKMVELTSEQWLSLPDGEPIATPKTGPSAQPQQLFIKKPH